MGNSTKGGSSSSYSKASSSNHHEPPPDYDADEYSILAVQQKERNEWMAQMEPIICSGNNYLPDKYKNIENYDQRQTRDFITYAILDALTYKSLPKAREFASLWIGPGRFLRDAGLQELVLMFEKEGEERAVYRKMAVLLNIAKRHSALF